MKGDYKIHLGSNDVVGLTLCGLAVIQGYDEMPLVRNNPASCTCRNCLTKYYLENPLTEQRTKTK